MISIFGFFRRFAVQAKGENLHRVLLLVFILVLAGSFAFWGFEKGLSFTDSLWWSIVTVTTVGYGDISPATFGGRIVGVILMMLGIGFIGVLTATVAGIVIENKFRENKGMKPVEEKGHLLLCGWNPDGKTVINEVRQDEKGREMAVVILAEMEEKPIDMPGVLFVRGDVNTETLAMANAGEASTALMLSDGRLEHHVRDAKTILDTLTVKSLYPDLYVTVELMEAKNKEHCRLAKADEIIVMGDLSSNLLAQAALDHGITRLVTELVSQQGQDLYKVDLPNSMKNRKFVEILRELKQSHDIICLGIEHGGDATFTANPSADYVPDENDRLLVIAPQRPKI